MVSVRSVGRNSKFHKVEKKQNIVLRDAQMDTEVINAKLRKLKRLVSDAVNYFMIIHVIPKDGNIVPMSVRTLAMLKLRSVSVHIAREYLKLIRPLQISVVRWNVERQDQRQAIGQYLKNYSGSVNSAAKNFGRNYPMLKREEENSVQQNVKTNPKLSVIKFHLVSTVWQYGKRHAQELLIGIKYVKNVGLAVKDSMSTILSTKDMVVQRMTLTLSPYVLIATGQLTVRKKLAPIKLVGR